MNHKREIKNIIVVGSSFYEIISVLSKNYDEYLGIESFSLEFVK